MKFALAVLSLVALASAVDVGVGYHRRVGIPLAMKIKAAEDAIIKRSINTRIAGGEEAEPDTHPFLVGILISLESTPLSSVCGGVLISRDKVLTAAVCTDDGVDTVLRYIVIAGSNMLFSGGQRIETTIAVAHPEWNPLSLENNVAVLALRNRLIDSAAARPIALPSNELDSDFTGEQAIAYGFGKTSDAQAGISVLTVVNQVEATVISTESCQSVYGWWVRASNICTSGAGGVGLCAGDIGGPLVAIRDDGPVLVGVASFYASTGCESGHPSAFTRVTSYYDFITKFL